MTLRVCDPNSVKMTIMQTDFREESTGLYEILHPLMMHWKLLAGGLIVGMILAAIASSLMSKQYQTSFLLNIGTAVDKILEDPYTVTKLFNNESFQQKVAAKVGLNLPPNRLQKMIEAETDNTRMAPWISVRVIADNPQMAVKLANAIADEILQRHSEFFNEKVQRYKDYKNELEQNIEQFKKEAETLKNNLDTYRSTPHDLSTEMLLQIRLSEKENQAIMFRRELRDQSTWLSTVHSRKTSLVAPPAFPTAPAKPNLKLNVMVAGMASLFLMISFVLLRERYRKGSLGI